jgi:RHH-type proline utilization regulon transcriptional repressor/proline dehydrogenase/delta 1-pyrroline-5-carboxylate dehydrogenase
VVFHVTPNNKTRFATCTNPATIQDFEMAVASAKKAWPAWRDLPLETRAARVNELGARLERDRVRLAAMEVHEQAKPQREADADVAEAIDFCRYYARQALLELGPRRQGDLAGEINTLTYEGRGLCAVIAPWNFPLAILCGMSTAALVAGNAVLLKPAEQANAIAFAFHRHALAAGIPPEVLQFLPGDGAVSSRSHSPGAGRSGHRSSGWRRKSYRGKRRSSGSSVKWAARTRSSSTMTPISTRRWPG